MEFDVDQMKLFIEHTPAAVAIFDNNMKYLYASKRWLKDYNLGEKNIIGLSHYEVFPEIPDRWREIHRRCLAGASEHCEEDPFERLDGQVDWVRWSIHPWYDRSGAQGGIIMFTEVITERKRLEEEKFQQYRRNQLQHNAILKIISSEAVVNGDFLNAVKFITETAAQTLEVERVGVWLLSDDQQELKCIDLYEQTAARHTNGLVVFAKDYPKYFKSIRSGRVVDAHDVLSDDRTQEFIPSYLKPLGITSMLDAAVRVSGKIVGIVCHEHTGPMRRWADDESRFASEIADQVAQVILNSERKEAIEKLHIAHADLEARVQERTAQLMRENVEREKTQAALNLSESELIKQKLVLEKKNLALREVLEQIEIEKQQIKSDITSNAEELLLPALKKLKRKGSRLDAQYLELLEKNLKNLATGFGGKISQGRWKLTPREIEICDMIKNGMSNKDISDMLHISVRTIEIHRNNIRKKLGLSRKGINLVSYLQNL